MQNPCAMFFLSTWFSNHSHLLRACKRVAGESTFASLDTREDPTHHDNFDLIFSHLTIILTPSLPFSSPLHMKVSPEDILICNSTKNAILNQICAILIRDFVSTELAARERKKINIIWQSILQHTLFALALLSSFK